MGNTDITEHSNKNERVVCLVACMVIVASSIISLFNNIVRSFVTLPYRLDTIIIYAFIIITALSALKTIIKRSAIQVYIVIYLLLLSYLVSFLFNGYYSDYYMKIGFNFVLNAAPWIIVTFAVRDFMRLKKYLYISSLIIMTSFVMNIFVFKFDIVNTQSYTQQYTYLLLPASVILADTLFDKLNAISAVLFVISLVFMLSMGARGPIVCVFLFLILKCITILKYNIKRALGIGIPVIFLLSGFYLYFYNVLTFLFGIFTRLNLSTRSVKKLMEGTFFQDNSRHQLVTHSIDIIQKNLFIGVGFGNDRILLASKMGNSNLFSDAIGWYPHNIFLEILLHFGIVAGGAIIIYLIWLVFIAISKNSDKFMTDTICIFIATGLFPLFFSGSYMDSPLFFALLGYCFYACKVYKNYKHGINPLFTMDQGKVA